MQTLTVIGIDIAKNIFQVHGADIRGKAILRKRLKRSQFLEFFVNLPACLIGMEACGGAHHWARELRKLGHDVRLISPQFVKPYVKSNKNDAADAQAICEAVSRPEMRFVSVKAVWQQEIQTLHSIRSQLLAQRVASSNSVHGLAAEFGVILPKSERLFFSEIRRLVSQDDSRLPEAVKELFAMMLDQIQAVRDKVQELDSKLGQVAAQNESCKRLESIPGVGRITSTAILGQVADVSVFKNGRQFAAWLGLVPRQNSSGGKTVLLGISKRGNVYLRSLLIHGARSVLRTVSADNPARLNQWILSKKLTRGPNRATVALANKNARIIWALLKNGGIYRFA